MPWRAEHILGRLSEHALELLVHKGEAPPGVQHVDEIGRCIDQKRVQPVVGLCAAGQRFVLPLEHRLVERVGHAGEQLLGLVGLREIVERTEAQDRRDRSQAPLAGQHDGLDAAARLLKLLEDVHAGDLRHVQIEYQDVIYFIVRLFQKSS